MRRPVVVYGLHRTLDETRPDPENLVSLGLAWFVLGLVIAFVVMT